MKRRGNKNQREEEKIKTNDKIIDNTNELKEQKDLYEKIEKNKEEVVALKEKLEKNNGLKSQILIYGKGPKRYVEFLSKNAGKGYVVEYLCKLNNVKIEDSLGFGDSLNDVQMLLTCGKGFMVANSQDGLVEWYKNDENKLKSSKLKFSDKSYAWVLLDEMKKLN